MIIQHGTTIIPGSSLTVLENMKMMRRRNMMRELTVILTLIIQRRKTYSMVG